ncbi:aldo/keto reductase [Haloarculaceae archaeon H-GB2-1]|nr:aldo/keto reductase [Haloarculaceae archaeon H-GB1-1]MEA5387990.1 aldo/keto reductase [Haloarculaceae archaeon H-GB11]MEA5409480.1 aldo/keto reductase [Haloarculaceae archaeon H-GB2-1]
MRYTKLGSTGLEVSELCLGTGLFGSGQRPTEVWEGCMDDEEASIELVERAIELGINFIDTANQYSTGEAEEIVGKAISEYDRDELVVNTKVQSLMADRPNGGGLSRKHIMDQSAKSLDRLQTDFVDLYTIHLWDKTTPIRETLSAMNSLVEDGKVRYLGASNVEGWQLMKSQWTADVNGFEPFSNVQSEYSAIQRWEEYGVIPALEDQDLGLTPYSPLGKGFLAGAYDRDELPAKDSRLGHGIKYGQWDAINTHENWEVFDVVSEIADEKDATPVQISLAWLLHKDAVDSAIIGPTTIPELEECVGAVDVSLSDDDMERIEDPIDPAFDKSWGWARNDRW